MQKSEERLLFFPGGHVEFGENAKAALFREIKEELGISIKKYKFIGFVENIFKERWGKHHEFNLIFEAVPARINTKSREGHLLFSFLDIGQLSRNKVLPVALKKFLLKWLNDKKVFWGSQIFNKYTHGF